MSDYAQLQADCLELYGDAPMVCRIAPPDLDDPDFQWLVDNGYAVAVEPSCRTGQGWKSPSPPASIPTDRGDIPASRPALQACEEAP